MNDMKNVLTTFAQQKNIKEVTLSIVITFIGAFLVYITPLFPHDASGVDQALIISLIVAGTRAGTKAVLQMLISKLLK